MLSTFRFSPLAASALLVLSSTVCNAGSEPPKELYVAGTGTDAGDCTSVTAPCRTISYALQFAGKHDRIQVATGSYAPQSPDEVFNIVNGSIDIRGGYKGPVSFSLSGANFTVISGAPGEFRDRLRMKGFNIVADAKEQNTQFRKRTDYLVSVDQQMHTSSGAAPCSDGSAGGLACDSVGQLSHFALNHLRNFEIGITFGADVWGFVDLNSLREYAIVGYTTGTVVFDISNPEVPLEVGFVPGDTDIWRDIKVYQYFDANAQRWRAHAYVTTDGAVSDGLVIIELSNLPHSVHKIDYSSDFLSAHNVYISGVDYSTGIRNSTLPPQLLTSGSNINLGEFRSYSLDDPMSPVFMSGGITPLPGSTDGASYAHDLSSMTVTDSRTSTQCNESGPACEVLMDFNEGSRGSCGVGEVALWNITDPQNPKWLGTTNYPEGAYSHSGWWSEDRQYVFVHDELDELRCGLGTTVRVLDVSDLTNPVLAATWTGLTQATDHNGFVRGNRYYMSNYTRGLTVLDITDAASPVMSGFLDTYQASDSRATNGAWGAYPFFYSGTVAISDRAGGLFLAEDLTRNVPEGSLGFVAVNNGIEEGQVAQLAVRRGGGSVGAVSVGYEAVSATAESSDYQVTAGRLEWADGDAADRMISLDAINDGVGENLEMVILRLVDPQGGATLADANTARIYVSDPGAASEVSFMSQVIDLPEQGFNKANIVLQRSGSALGAISVDYSITGGDATAGTDFQGPTIGTVSWADGDADPKVVTFTITDDGGGEETENFQLTLNNAVGASVGATDTVNVRIHDRVWANAAPTVSVSANQTLGEGVLATLDGSQSSDVDGQTLSYLWTQTGGPAVDISDATSASASFMTPSVATDTELTFSLMVTDSGYRSSVAATTVTVTSSAPPGGGSTGGGSSGGGSMSLLALLGLTLLLASVCAPSWSVAKSLRDRCSHRISQR